MPKLNIIEVPNWTENIMINESLNVTDFNTVNSSLTVVTEKDDIVAVVFTSSV